MKLKIIMKMKIKPKYDNICIRTYSEKIFKKNKIKLLFVFYLKKKKEPEEYTKKILINKTKLSSMFFIQWPQNNCQCF